MSYRLQGKMNSNQTDNFEVQLNRCRETYVSRTDSYPELGISEYQKRYRTSLQNMQQYDILITEMIGHTFHRDIRNWKISRKSTSITDPITESLTQAKVSRPCPCALADLTSPPEPNDKGTTSRIFRNRTRCLAVALTPTEC